MHRFVNPDRRMIANRHFVSAFDVAVVEHAAAVDHEYVASGAGARATVIAVEPWGQGRWSGSFAAPDPGRRALTAWYGTASPHGLCMIERGTPFLGDVRHPEGFEVSTTRGPVVAAEELVDDDLLLLLTPWAITALDGDGSRWTTPRLAIDGVRLDETER